MRFPTPGLSPDRIFQYEAPRMRKLKTFPQKNRNIVFGQNCLTRTNFKRKIYIVKLFS
jgi:hypothetical protein